MMKKTLWLLVLGLGLFLSGPAQAAEQFWEDYQLRLKAEEGKLEVAYSHVGQNGIYRTDAWWFNGTKGVISRLVISQDVFFLHRYDVLTDVNQPWLHEFIPGCSHVFEGGGQVGKITVRKVYTWFESQFMWEYPINRYYQHHEGKSFFRLRQGSTWIFWVIDPLAEEETTL
jgi:hypothetical protein